MFCGALDLPRAAYLNFPDCSPDRGNGKRRPTVNVRFALHTPTNRRISCADFRTKDATLGLMSKSIW